MSEKTPFLVMNLGAQRIALELDVVERVVRMVEITPLPAAAENLRGVINVQGAIVPVVSLQTYLGLPAAAVSVSDQLVIVRASGERRVALAVNGTDGVVMCSEEACIHAETIFPHLEGVAGVIKGPDGMIMISDLARLLRFDGEEVLAEALAAAENVT